MMTEKTPDAIRSPLPHAGAGDSQTRLARLHSEFAPVLKVPALYVRHQGTEHFISGKAGDTLNFPCHDVRSGSPRYDWVDRGDRVLYGYLKPDA